MAEKQNVQENLIPEHCCLFISQGVWRSFQENKEQIYYKSRRYQVVEAECYLVLQYKEFLCCLRRVIGNVAFIENSVRKYASVEVFQSAGLFLVIGKQQF